MNDQLPHVHTFTAVDSEGVNIEIQEIRKAGSSHSFLKLVTGEAVNALGGGKYQVIRVGEIDESILTKA